MSSHDGVRLVLPTIVIDVTILAITLFAVFAGHPICRGSNVFARMKSLSSWSLFIIISVFRNVSLVICRHVRNIYCTG